MVKLRTLSCSSCGEPTAFTDNSTYTDIDLFCPACAQLLHKIYQETGVANYDTFETTHALMRLAKSPEARLADYNHPSHKGINDYIKRLIQNGQD